MALMLSVDGWLVFRKEGNSWKDARGRSLIGAPEQQVAVGPDDPRLSAELSLHGGLQSCQHAACVAEGRDGCERSND